MKTGSLSHLLLVLACSPMVAADDDSNKKPASYSFKSLSLELAGAASWGALKECRKRGYSVAVAVLDHGGNVQALLRDRSAGPHTPETAIRKAWSANTFRQSTASLERGVVVARSNVRYRP